MPWKPWFPGKLFDLISVTCGCAGDCSLGNEEAAVDYYMYVG